MSTPLRVASIQVKGVLGITEGAIEPGKVTLLSGKNGSSKTSWVDAFLAGLGGGNLAKLAHLEDGKPAKAEVVIVLKGDREYRIEKKGKATAAVLAQVGDSQFFEDLGKPQSWLDGLFDKGGCSIVKLLKSEEDELATLILEALPLELDRAELADILKDLPPGVIFRPVPAGLYALDELSQVFDDVYTARTGVNRDLDWAKKSADQLRRALPATLPVDPAKERAQLQARRDTLAEQIAADRKGAAAAEEHALAAAAHEHELAGQTVVSAFTQARAAIRAAHEQEAAQIRAEAERVIAEKLVLAEQTVESLRESDEATLAEIEAKRDAALEQARNTRAAADTARQEKEGQLALMNQQLAQLARDAEEAHKAKGLVEQLEKNDAAAAGYKVDADRLTATLNALDGYRLRLAKSLPVPGLEIAGQVVRVNGVPWSQLNKAQRVALLVKVSVLRAQGRPLPLILVDDAETLDSEHFELLVDELKNAGVQALITKVADTPFKVETLA